MFAVYVNERILDIKLKRARKKLKLKLTYLKHHLKGYKIMNNLKLTSTVLKAFDKDIKGAKAQEFACPELITQMQALAVSIKKAQARKTPIADWSSVEVAKHSSDVTQLRYKMLFNKSQKALTYLIENNINPCAIKRNVYGKVTQGVTLIQKGYIAKFEQSDYVEQIMSRLLGMEKIEADFTFTAGQLAAIQGKVNDDGKISGMSTSTQPFATFDALKLIKAGFITEKQNRNDSWKTRSFTLDANSPFIKAYNSLCAD